MSKTRFYHQCVLTRQNDSSFSARVSWIPEEFAILGRVVKLKAEDGIWVDGWKVGEVGARQEAAYVENHAMDHRRQRQASDI